MLPLRPLKMLVGVLLLSPLVCFAQVVDVAQISSGPQDETNDATGYSPDGLAVCFQSTEVGGARGLRCGPADVTASHVPVHDILPAGKAVYAERFSSDGAFVYFLAPGFGAAELFRGSLTAFGSYEQVSRTATSGTEAIQKYLLSDQNAVVEWANGVGPEIESVSLSAPTVPTDLDGGQVYTGVFLRVWANASRTRILYYGTVSGQNRLFAIDVDGSDFATLSFPGASPLLVDVSEPTGLVLYKSSGAGAGDDMYIVPLAGGSSTRLSAATNTPQIVEATLSASGDNVCYLERFNTTQYWLSCGPVGNPGLLQSFGYITDYDEDLYTGLGGVYLPIVDLAVLDETLVALVNKAGQQDLVAVHMDGSGTVETLAQDVTGFSLVEALGGVVYRRETGAANPFSWHFMAPLGAPPTLLFEEESTTARGFYLDYSAPANRLIFRRDVNALPGVRLELFTVAPDGSQPDTITGGPFDLGLTLPLPKLSVDQTTVIHTVRSFNLVSGDSSTRVRAANLMNGTTATLLVRTDPDGQPPRGIADIALSPIDPLGTLISAQSETVGQGYDFWLTQTHDPVLFADGFE